MAGSNNPPKARKRVAVDCTMKRARDGSAFTRCEACNKDVPVVLIDMHSCSLDSKIRMNLESQVMEKVAEVKKSAERKRSATSDDKEGRTKKERKGKDPNRPKRPPTAFFLFMNDFRKEFKEANPDSKSVATMAKEGGEKWKSMSEEDKRPYFDRATELKAEYEKAAGKQNAADEENEGSGKEEETQEKEADDEE